MAEITNPFKTGGPETVYEIKAVRCCRVWPIISSTLTWTENIDGWKHETWWWRNCPLCDTYPQLVDNNPMV